MLKLPDQEEKGGSARRGLPGWVGTGAAAVAEPLPQALEADLSAESPGDSPSESEVESLPQPEAAEPPRRASSTAVLGGIFASVVFHIWLLAMLSSLDIERLSRSDDVAIDAVIAEEETTPDEPDEPVKFELAEPNEKEDEIRQAADAMSIGRERAAESRIQTASVLDSFSGDQIGIAPPAQYEVFSQGMKIDERIEVQGTTGEAMEKVEAALDRVTWEIANHLEEHKALVVWLLDASGSLKQQRATISSRLRRIYTELGVLEDKKQLAARTDQALLSGVVMYGEKTVFVTSEPTDKFDVVQDAVKNAPTDPSGVENVFGAVDQVVHKWQKYRTSQGRSILIIIVTDETGDDFDRLESAILTCKRYGAKAYVIGPAAVFGRRQAFVPYVAPENKKTYQLPVDLGPESFVLEVPVLPFWFSSSQYEFLSSGMGPYGLSRLVHETGGVYFMTTMTTSAGFSPIGNFDPVALKPFEPDYRFGTPQEYINDVNRHRLRQAVMHASELSLKHKAGGAPTMELRVTPQNYLQQLSNAQKTVAETSYMLDLMLSGFSGNLEPEYQREPSPRWRANYNLTYGRLLALKLRAQEYNFACAQLKQLGSGDIEKKTNHWYFKPSRKLSTGPASRKQAAEAERLLKRAVDDAPNTPWGLLAQRELSTPMGFEVVQKFDPPPKPSERRNEPAATPGKKQVRLADDTPKKKKPDAPPAPPPEPKLPKL